jgi:hypothetical protein
MSTTITKRLVKGTPLSNAELDANFQSIVDEKLERDGTVAMTGSLVTPGLSAASAVAGLTAYNQDGDLIFTAGADNSQDVIFEGNIEVGGTGGNLNLGTGDIQAKDIYLSGRLISEQLSTGYAVSNRGELFQANGVNTEGVSPKFVVTMKTCLKLIELSSDIENWNIGDTVIGANSEATGVITHIIGNDIYVTPATPTTEFESGETITVSGAGLQAVIDIALNAKNTILAGQKLKMFGVDLLDSEDVDDTPTAQSVAVIGTPPVSGGKTYRYWVAQYRFDNGKIAAAVQLTQASVHYAPSLLNESTNLVLTLSRSAAPAGQAAVYGLLIYRSLDSSNAADARLVAVLGPGEINTGESSNILYTDAGTYYDTEWSTKDVNGAYTSTSGIYHFPVTPPTTPRAGWGNKSVIDIKVEQVINASTFRMTHPLDTNTDTTALTFVHDNTSGLQAAIDANRALSLRNIEIPSGTYYTSRLVIPNDFTVTGAGTRTIIKQIPWNYDHYANAVDLQRGSVFKSLEDNPAYITMQDFILDGNFINNTKWRENTSTYIADIQGGANIDIFNVTCQNTPGGGFNILTCQNLRFQDNVVRNGGGATYYGGDNFSPLTAASGDTITVTGNVFENFPAPLDFSVSRYTVACNNTVKNCGSGMLVYASAHLLASPNLLLGPDNEFLPNPDTMDSDYNSINIPIERNTDQASVVGQYYEAGQAVHLGSNRDYDSSNIEIPGTEVTLTTQIFPIGKVDGAEVAFDTTAFRDYSYRITGYDGNGDAINALDSNSNPIPLMRVVNGNSETGLEREQGYFKLQIARTDTTETQIPSLLQLREKLIDEGIVTAPVRDINGFDPHPVVGLAWKLLATTFIYAPLADRIDIISTVFSTESGTKYATIEIDINSIGKFAISDTIKTFDVNSTSDNINNIELEVVATTTALSSGYVKCELPSGFTIAGNGGATGYITNKKTIMIAKGRLTNV